jgi:pimeloyl-ACP methyl ester carboxylesterase
MPLNLKGLNSKKLPNIRIEKPTLVLWGIEYSAFCPEILDGLEQYVSKLKIVKFEDATHWLHHEIPHQIHSEIESFIA